MTVRVSREWLALREPADAAARARDLVEHLPRTDRHVIHDLGCGTGAMGRWLAPMLTGPQRWVLHDRDAELLEVAAVPGVTVEARRSDVTRLRPSDLAGATLITASALLDMLTEQEVIGLVDLCAQWPALLMLSVVGRVELTPPDPLDRRLQDAFNAHQRRATLGPDAFDVAVAELRRRGAEVLVRPSPWRLGASELAMGWLTGWVGAACEQEPGLVAEAEAYTRRRLAQLRAGALAVTVGHADLLALPQSVPNRGESP
jgi:Methyltransferase small domain